LLPQQNPATTEKPSALTFLHGIAIIVPGTAWVHLSSDVSAHMG